jgi:hypothetical protein
MNLDPMIRVLAYNQVLQSHARCSTPFPSQLAKESQVSRACHNSEEALACPWLAKAQPNTAQPNTVQLKQAQVGLCPLLFTTLCYFSRHGVSTPSPHHPVTFHR